MKKNKVDKFMDEIVKKIDFDRERASILLTNVMQHIMGNTERHKEVGLVAAKYLETLQKSNEQLVKIAALMSKDTENKKITKDELEDLYDEIGNGPKNSENAEDTEE